MSTKLQNAGFTLIELIIVIVLLGVLAVTAAPKFIDIGSDARIATVNQLAGVLKATSTIVRAKCVVLRECNENARMANITLDGVRYDLNYGWPDAGDKQNNAQIDALFDHDGFTASLVDLANTRFSLDSAPDSSMCWANYKDAFSSTDELVVITVETSGC